MSEVEPSGAVQPSEVRTQARRPSAPREERPRSCLGSLAAGLGVLAGTIYILNPGLGIFELLPDNLPGVGNLDEAGAAALLIFGLRYLLRRR